VSSEVNWKEQWSEVSHGEVLVDKVKWSECVTVKF
jgi:hypothetical protein